MASMIEPWVSPVITAVAGASPWPTWPVSVCTSTTMSSTWLTVRSAVLNGVFSGTRSMPNWISVIFMRLGGFLSSKGRRRRRQSRADVHDAGHAVDIGMRVVPHQRHQRRHRHFVELYAAHGAAVQIGDASGVVDHVRVTVQLADHHHHVAGDV